MGTCSETLFHVLDRAFSQSMPFEEHGSMPLAGGIMRYGYQCGMLWGAALAAGLRAHRLLGTGPQAETEAIVAAQRLVESLRTHYRSIDCRAITGVDWRSKNGMFKYFLKGGPIACFHMAARYAPLAFQEINSALHQKNEAAPAAPVSCAALLARRMGATDQQVSMAAGLAGGIGLSGGGCGALGAAIWLIETNYRQQNPNAKADFDNPRAKEVIERFRQASKGEFTCEKIVGRKFASVADHAKYLHGGGCADILAALAAD
ncbi:MAG TPA: C-GCAxxG-C-C family (seleno)protein [bacterium]|nr:C-GCAxxG-C-C family (seleno)protein [bacterium]